ncbi:ubiquitin carboxyl-terminal hydrolase 44-A [Pelomyxa schiedti]|nr:ubiquitin carboxyl-terminal hydrolase 44-A [Pelomyxa schiedti]
MVDTPDHSPVTAADLVDVDLEDQQGETETLHAPTRTETTTTTTTSGSASTPCLHFKSASVLEVVTRKLLNPSKWLCQSCRTTDSICGCLDCGSISCCLSPNGHAYEHFKETSHPLVLNINLWNCHCFACNSTTPHTELASTSIGALVSSLSKTQAVASSSIKVADDASPSLLRTVSVFQHSEEKFVLKDKTALSRKHYSRSLLHKVLSIWRVFANRKKTPPPASVSEISPSPTTSSNRRALPRQVVLSRHTGLRNLGNTCFINSVLQSVACLDEFQHYFINTKYNPSPNVLVRRDTVDCFQSVRDHYKSNKTLSQQLHELLRVMKSGKWNVVSPMAFVESLWKFVPRFRSYKQQDAQEFLVYLFDQLSTEYEKLVKALPKNVKSTSYPVTDLFDGTLISTITCSRCSHTSGKEDHFLDLSLNIPTTNQNWRTSRTKVQPRGTKANKGTSSSLIKCFKSFYKKELLADKWRCDNCKQRAKFTKQLAIQKFPQIMCVVLKRFEWLRTSKRKIFTAVKFPFILNTSRFHPGEPATSASSLPFYELCGVIIHEGRGTSQGHYTCYCHSAGEWVHFNDAYATVVQLDQVMANASQCGYIFFYKKCDGPPPISGESPDSSESESESSSGIDISDSGSESDSESNSGSESDSSDSDVGKHPPDKTIHSRAASTTNKKDPAPKRCEAPTKSKPRGGRKQARRDPPSASSSSSDNTSSSDYTPTTVTKRATKPRRQTSRVRRKPSRSSSGSSSSTSNDSSSTEADGNDSSSDFKPPSRKRPRTRKAPQTVKSRRLQKKGRR